MKKSKSIFIFAALLILLFAICALTACNGDAQHAHSYVQVDAKQPTCAEAGNILYYTCSCGKYFDADKREIDLSSTVIPATGQHVPTWVTDVDANCGRDGHKYEKCSVCGKKLNGEETIPASGAHTWGDKLTDGKVKCSVCGTDREVYKTDGDKIYFGSYPQSEVTQSTLIDALNAEAGEKPTEDNAENWSSYTQYYYGGSASYASDAWYIDVSYENEMYRGVYFLTNLLDAIWYSSVSTQLNNGYETGQIYWFKWEPIEWVKVKTEGGKAMLLANIILDGQYWSASNDGYANSNIRQFLNERFYADAFSELEAKFIAVAAVDNSAASTTNPDNKNVCEDTNDKVFIPSLKEIDEMDAADVTLSKKTSAYARIRGVYTVPDTTHGLERYYGYGTWWTRSQNSSNVNKVRGVLYDGDRGGSGSNYYALDGVLPAIYITL